MGSFAKWDLRQKDAIIPPAPRASPPNTQHALEGRHIQLWHSCRVLYASLSSVVALTSAVLTNWIQVGA